MDMPLLWITWSVVMICRHLSTWFTPCQWQLSAVSSWLISTRWCWQSLSTMSSWHCH